MRKDPERAGRGRRRGDEKSEDDVRHEMQAKGHIPKQVRERGEEFHGMEQKHERGRQRGFGKNQGKEASDLSTAHGTKAAGAEHG